MTNKIGLRGLAAGLTLVLGLVTAVGGEPQGSGSMNQSRPDKERELIAVLNSKATPAEKAITCKRLAVYGSEKAVPALAPLLLDKELASWARIALEAIPGPEPDAALRQAAGKLQGRLLIGTINSIGYRKDPKAVNLLAKKLNDPDTGVASASAIALGHISGVKAAKALEQALENSPEATQAAVAEGCVLCAERFLGQGAFDQAVALYDTVRKSNAPKQQVLEATRGAILARRAEGLPLLLTQLRSADKGRFEMGLHTARQFGGREVTEALAAELTRTTPERQAPLLLALADRNDEAVLPAVMEAARSGSRSLRLAAVRALDRLGKVSSVPVLLEAAASGDADLGKAALDAVARMAGTEVDGEVLHRLESSARMKQALIEIAGRRRVEAALPAIAPNTQDADAGVRRAAVQVLGTLGSQQQVAELVKLLQKTHDSKQRDDIETALVELSGRHGAGCVPALQPILQGDDKELRLIGLHVAASAGGSEALAAVKAAVEDKDESVQDEAVRTLSTWPSNWPDDAAVAEPLLSLARSAGKNSHQVLALRGYLEYVKSNKQLKDDEKVQKVNELLPLLKRAEEKRLVLATLDAIPTAAVLEMFVSFAGETDLAEDASSALIKLAEKNDQGLSKEQRQKALHAVIGNSRNDGTKKKAEEMLKGI